MSNNGDGVKPQYEYKGRNYQALSLEQYSILEHHMRQDIIDQAVEAMKMYEPDEDTKVILIDRAYQFRNRVSITSVEGLKLLDTATYQKHIVELSIEAGSKDQLTRDQCRETVNKMSLADVVTIARNLLVLDNIFADMGSPEWAKNVKSTIENSVAETLKMVTELEESLKEGGAAKKNESKDSEDPKTMELTKA